MNSVIQFFKDKPVSITAFVMAVVNLAAVFGIDALKDPSTVGAINLALTAFLGLFVTQTVTSNNSLVGKALGGFSGVSDEVEPVDED